MANDPIRPQLAGGFATAGRPGATERVIQILKRFIVTEQLEPGARLPPERRLADSLSVSRTVLREAISQLIGEGLIVRTSPRIICVAEFDRNRLASQIAPIDVEEAELRHLIELRVVIEVGAIELIVERATEDDLKRIKHWIDEGERRVAAGSPIDIVDVRFHAALLQTFDNPAINSLMPVIEDHLRFNIAQHPHRLQGSEVNVSADRRVAEEHRRIYDAIVARDVEAARAATWHHLRFYLGNAPAEQPPGNGLI